MRLDFKQLLKEANGSTLKAFNTLVLRIEQLSAIATPDKQTDKAKIGTLMSTIEAMPWYVLATVGVEGISHFSGVVQKVNHELAKISVCDPSLGEMVGKMDSDRANIRKDILYALGIDGDSDSSKEDSDDNDTAKSTESDHDKYKRIQFGGQRTYCRDLIATVDPSASVRGMIDIKTKAL